MKTLGSSSTQQICTTCGAEYQANYMHGVFQGPPFDMSGGHCPQCREVREREQEAKEDKLRLAEKDATREMWRNACGIPDLYQQATLHSFDTDRPGNVGRVRDDCLKYADGFPIDYLAYKKQGKAYPSLVLFSTDVWGIGKTHLACAIAHRILDRWNGERTGCPVLFISEPDIYRRIQATFDYSPQEKVQLESKEDIMRSLLYTPLLILDDVGKEARSDPRFIQRTMFEIIDGRNKNLRPIVLTTNKSAKDLELYLGSASDHASFERLWAMCGSPAKGFLKMTGESYRRKE